ncbi:hypothetical protein NDN08_004616 [Rhodosorus marinus]|uniref:fructose-bisphosphatase n=1 Tax=Rhodosorus marinus TaxID=101924 RepID=A0AAV8ULS8_9RHOD|nr:hypothetical protein NDN08_004616 [Rhodosorus marinus]
MEAFLGRPGWLDVGRCRRSVLVCVRAGTSLRSFGAERGWSVGLKEVCGAVKEGLYQTSNKVRRAGLDALLGGTADDKTNASGDSVKALDVVANDLFVDALGRCEFVNMIASEEEDDVVVKEDPNEDGYAVVFDPLDGSSNIAACIPTGTIFGVYKTTGSGPDQALQLGSKLALAGYCLYSAATILVLSDGSGTFAFTLDSETGDFVLTHPNIKVPQSGSSYSVNDGRFHDWPTGLQQYITDIKNGRGRTGRKYDTKYICSLVADVHYVLFRGGIAMNPRAHLRLVYEGNPIAFIVENAGGAASTGVGRILEVEPTKPHHRLPIFVGSRLDIEELESYDDKGGVRQMHNPGYKY